MIVYIVNIVSTAVFIFKNNSPIAWNTHRPHIVFFRIKHMQPLSGKIHHLYDIRSFEQVQYIAYALGVFWLYASFAAVFK